jgi:hypothetical protein
MLHGLLNTDQPQTKPAIVHLQHFICDSPPAIYPTPSPTHVPHTPQPIAPPNLTAPSYFRTLCQAFLPKPTPAPAHSPMHPLSHRDRSTPHSLPLPAPVMTRHFHPILLCYISLLVHLYHGSARDLFIADLASPLANAQQPQQELTRQSSASPPLRGGEDVGYSVPFVHLVPGGWRGGG